MVMNIYRFNIVFTTHIFVLCGTVPHVSAHTLQYHLFIEPLRYVNLPPPAAWYATSIVVISTGAYSIMQAGCLQLECLKKINGSLTGSRN